MIATCLGPTTASGAAAAAECRPPGAARPPPPSPLRCRRRRPLAAMIPSSDEMDASRHDAWMLAVPSPDLEGTGTGTYSSFIIFSFQQAYKDFAAPSSAEAPACLPPPAPGGIAIGPRSSARRCASWCPASMSSALAEEGRHKAAVRESKQARPGESPPAAARATLQRVHSIGRAVETHRRECA